MEASGKVICDVLIERYGQLFSEALGLDLRLHTPTELFRWLCAALLLGGRIRASSAQRAAQALMQSGWTTPAAMAASSWEERTRLLNRSGYARYDESTSTLLGRLAATVEARYGGDLRKLREAAGRQPDAERRLLKELPGIGDVRADIFCREVQMIWDELYPFADRRALHAAAELRLGGDASALARLVDRTAFPRLVAALVRLDLGKRASECGQATFEDL